MSKASNIAAKSSAPQYDNYNANNNIPSGQSHTHFRQPNGPTSSYKIDGERSQVGSRGSLHDDVPGRGNDSRMKQQQKQPPQQQSERNVDAGNNRYV
jgi:hypothetical protein